MYEYITDSRKEQGYIDLINKSSNYFKEILGVGVRQLGFLLAPIDCSDCPELDGMIGGKMYQVRWNDPNIAYVVVWFDTVDPEFTNIINEYVEANTDILFDWESLYIDDNSRKSYIKEGIDGLDFNADEFYKLIN